MSYQVNLLLPTERRSGGHVSRKFVIRIAAAIVLGLLVVGIATLIVGAQVKQSQLRSRKDYWAGVDKTYKSVQKLETDKKKIEQIAADAEGWRVSRVAWSVVLGNLPAMVPTTMQLTQMMLSETLDSSPARQATLMLGGKVGGDYPELDVKALRESLRNDPQLKSLLAGVDVKRYEADPVPGSDLKVFSIECRFAPRPMKP
jgi:Tfp pilus assembly protein PilN